MAQFDSADHDEPHTLAAEVRDHDIRNALTVARLQIDVTRRRLRRAPCCSGSDMDRALDRVRTSIDRALGLLDREESTAGKNPARRYDD
jgi:hypothetical protein